jgi:hypothetical protein
MRLAPLLVAAGLLAQGALLGLLAGAGAAAGLLLAGGAALAGAAAVLAWPRLAPPARASLAMLAAGGSGMTLGWWADLGFASAAAAGPAAAGWCGLAPGGVPGLHLWCWMNAGMLAAGALAMRLVHGPRAARAIAGDGLAMVLGMSAGAALAARWGESLPAEAAVVSAHAAMNAGMLAGMQLAALAHIARRRRPPARAATALPAPL